ncbi:D-glycero-alpha-D-manno-heptose-1,7-bisphosphate 7-phosphatase [Luteolibacter algae]|uniref:D,D-heptose 1,7-bisphosphate phosphatase n=1 Tax=Luteolibacter algae TaxID=454151 RepID=A0ABW5D9X2_9BACT
MTPKALILDRDGTLIEHVPYLSNPKDIRLLPGVEEGLRLALDSGAKLFLHTNQSGVGRGYFDIEAVDRCNNRLFEILGENVPFQAVCSAPEAPGMPSKYRKPSPRFAREVMNEYSFRPDEVCYVGDRGSDIATAEAAGTRAVGVATGLDDLRSEIGALKLLQKYPVFTDFLSAMKFLFPKL